MLSLWESDGFAHATRSFSPECSSGQPINRDDAVVQFNLLPQQRRRSPWTAAVIGTCAEASLLAVATGHVLIAAVLCSSCWWALEWLYRNETVTNGDWDGQGSGGWWLIRMLAPAAILIAACIWLLLPSGGNAGKTGRAEKVGGEKVGRAARQKDTSWIGIILQPSTPRKATVIPHPVYHVPSISAAHLARPLVIPFSGSYWYFKAPARKPDSRAHISRESPTAAIIRSSDWTPIVMEAHQALSVPIDVMCCREIDLAIRNGDNRPGRIDIAVKLIDSSTSRSEDLGPRLVLSSMASAVRVDRPQVDEILRYRLPARSSLLRFNEITVIFEPSPERALGAAQIAIREFRLIP